MGSNKAKFEFSVPKDQVAETLASLGQALSGGTFDMDDISLDLAELHKLKLKLKCDGEICFLKFEVKYPEDAGNVCPCGIPGCTCEGARLETQASDADQETAGDDNDDGDDDDDAQTSGTESLGKRPKYKKLKKRMEKPWKTILDALAKGETPPSEATVPFVQDSELMITYPDEGDEYYGEYALALEEFKAALAASDLAALQTAAGKLESVKKECHDKYK